MFPAQCADRSGYVEWRKVGVSWRKQWRKQQCKHRRKQNLAPMCVWYVYGFVRMWDVVFAWELH